METLMTQVVRPIWLAAVMFGLAHPALAHAQTTLADPLPAWNDGKPKRAIIDFVTRVTTQGGPDFVSPAERIAAIDNDGTLWCEQPIYFQALFVFDRVVQLAAKHPEFKEKQPFRAILENDRVAMANFTKHDLAALLAATHSGMTTEEFDLIARNWLDSAHHPRFGQLYKECVFKPQLELLAYLKANEFKTFIVSGGGIDFVRAYAEKTYGVPPERVVGSSTKTKFELRDGKAEVIKLPELNSLDDGAGKPININLHIGRRPILAFGNSDGDLEMLQYTADGAGPRLMLLLHHDDALREYAYDRHSKVGQLDKAWDEALKRGWLMVSMKQDFKTVFAFEK
jgi:phosphoglycolate phosphatase-like HAD superfamily hydrolase